MGVSQEIHENTGKYREIQGNTGKYRRIQENTGIYGRLALYSTDSSETAVRLTLYSTEAVKQKFMPNFIWQIF